VFNKELFVMLECWVVFYNMAGLQPVTYLLYYPEGFCADDPTPGWYDALGNPHPIVGGHKPELPMLPTDETYSAISFRYFDTKEAADTLHAELSAFYHHARRHLFVTTSANREWLASQFKPSALSNVEAHVELCRELLIRLDVIKYEEAYAQRHDTDWDECMTDGLYRGFDPTDLTRLIVRRFLNLQLHSAG
jgi:hypothetical protein